MLVLKRSFRLYKKITVIIKQQTYRFYQVSLQIMTCDCDMGFVVFWVLIFPGLGGVGRTFSSPEITFSGGTAKYLTSRPQGKKLVKTRLSKISPDQTFQKWPSCFSYEYRNHNINNNIFQTMHNDLKFTNSAIGITKNILKQNLC